VDAHRSIWAAPSTPRPNLASPSSSDTLLNQPAPIGCGRRRVKLPKALLRRQFSTDGPEPSMFRNVPALFISILTHALVIAGLWAWKYTEITESPKLMVETVFMEERPEEEFTQEMTIDTSVSESLSVTAGGTVTGQLGSANANPMATQNIEQSEALKDPEINVTQFAMVTQTGLGDVNLDLGEGEVSGEVGAKVEGYGAAMHRLTHELRRMMREEPVIVVWLMDSTKSLEDDRKEISENFNKIYEELEISKKQGESQDLKYNLLDTMICSFGAGLKKLTPKPTAELEEIRAAIGRVSEDKTGEEKIYNSLKAVLEEYGRQARSTGRKLAVVVLTDEVGDDPELLEEVVDRAKLYKAPVYFLGREATFGYPYARIKWVNPKSKLEHWIPIRRGPETAMVEALQYDGFGRREESASSGFAPYPHARLVKESGGMYFMLQTEEKDLTGSAARLQRKFDDIRMKQYEPDLEPVREYVQERDKSEFRKTIFGVISLLNPYADENLGLAWQLPIEPDKFKDQGQEHFQRGMRALKLMSAGLEQLDKVRELRDLEEDPRWRAAYDLTYAQLLAYRVRVFQYLLAVDHVGNAKPIPKDPKSNKWRRVSTGEMKKPTEEQIKNTGVDIAELEQQRKKAAEMFAFVAKEHPGTPWAQRAQSEKGANFGIELRDVFWDPRYDTPEERAAIPKF
jgi:hypothetical protein